VIELADEHRGHAVERGALLLGDALQARQGIEGLGRDDHRRAVGGAGEVPQDHAEAVVEGHRDEHPIVLGQLHRLTHEVAVVEHVVVGEHRPLGKAGGARGVLNVDGVIELQGVLAGGEGGVAHVLAHVGEHLPVVFEHHGHPQGRAAGADLRQHAHVVVLAKRLGQQQHLGLRLAQRVLQLGRLVGGVDVHQDRPHPRRRVLQHHPLEAVGRPHADAVTALHAQRQQPLGHRRRLIPQLAVRRAVALPAHHQRVVISVARHGAAQVLADGLAQQRHRAGAVGVRERPHARAPASPRRSGRESRGGVVTACRCVGIMRRVCPLCGAEH